VSSGAVRVGQTSLISNYRNASVITEIPPGNSELFYEVGPDCPVLVVVRMRASACRVRGRSATPVFGSGANLIE